MPDARRSLAALLGLLLLLPAGEAYAEEDPGAWEAYAGRHEEIEAFAGDYMGFLGRSQTETLAVEAAVDLARRAGFVEIAPGQAPPPRRGFYVVNRDRALLVVRPGRRPLADGLRITAAHIDTPRLDLKARPLYEAEGFVLAQTIPHGGIKYYQWANVPLALVGHVDKMSGERVRIALGFEKDDPIFLIPDLAPHVDRPRRGRTSREVLQGEELDPLVGSKPGDEEDGPVDRIQALLEDRYGITSDDFVSAELRLVPAQPPREVGLDRGMIVGYGQDDKSCGYAALRALLDTRSPEHWSAVYLADNEETGSINNTGARSAFLRTTIESWLEAAGEDAPPLGRVLAKTVVASADVTTGINPLDPGVQEKTNASRLNGGIVIKRYGRGTDAGSEILAMVRRLLHENAIPWQTHTYKVDVGGGGTLGGYLSVWDMEVFDVGVPLLSMHSPAEVSSKADLYAFYDFLAAFYAGADDG